MYKPNSLVHIFQSVLLCLQCPGNVTDSISEEAKRVLGYLPGDSIRNSNMMGNIDITGIGSENAKNSELESTAK